MSDNRNLILAAILSMAVLFGWQYFFIEPQLEAERVAQAEQAAQQAAAATASSVPQVLESAPNAPEQGISGTALTGLPRDLALEQSPRVKIKTDTVNGSIALRGGRIDDLHLHNYRETIEENSPEITLLSPSNSITPYFAEFGWSAPASSGLKLPGRDTEWQLASGTDLTPTTPVTLRYDNGQGLVFQRVISIDENYLFTVDQSVENKTGKAVTLFPYGLISRTGTPTTSGFYILHEGMIGVMGEQEGLVEIDYDDLLEDREVKYSANNGWLGITDKYWATALIPEQGAQFDARYSESPNPRRDVYQADYLLTDGVVAQAGETVSHVARLFAGAKVVDVVDGYDDAGVFRFELLIDWGWFYFLTKPLFKGLDLIAGYVGNFGIAILVITVLIKLAFFPLANRSYEAMSKMKKLQPKMEKLREQYADDKMKQHQAIMELYKTEKVNPIAGCLPVVIQIPVFFALYKVLFVTLEMRHAPFFGWIQDLAAPDPTTLFNLFGLIPWDPPSFLMIGIWPLLMGITMFVQQRMNPAPADPTQQMIFTWMPVFFVFLLAGFPAGLVIYWAWNNLLSVTQQGVIMRRQGVPIELFSNLGFEKIFKRNKAE
ncbi:MAG: membrane protein insertase YidC [Rhodobiaceae bacterium]|nr:membrane protein insertase YidC [Rhodobiaceae bacterium]